MIAPVKLVTAVRLYRFLTSDSICRPTPFSLSFGIVYQGPVYVAEADVERGSLGRRHSTAGSQEFWDLGFRATTRLM